MRIDPHNITTQQTEAHWRSSCNGNSLSSNVLRRYGEVHEHVFLTLSSLIPDIINHIANRHCIDKKEYE
jgi:hypothetical protein